MFSQCGQYLCWTLSWIPIGFRTEAYLECLHSLTILYHRPLLVLRWQSKSFLKDCITNDLLKPKRELSLYLCGMEELKHWLFGSSKEMTIRRAVPVVSRTWMYLTLEVTKSTGAFDIWASCFNEGIWRWWDTLSVRQCMEEEIVHLSGNPLQTSTQALL